MKNPQFYINIKNPPEKGDPIYDKFFQQELDKIRYGVTIDGFYFHGWLYWHLNHWKIAIDVLDNRSGEVVRKFTNPQLRDNELLISKYLKIAEDEKKGFCIVGCRRFAKSVFESSYIGRSATIYEGGENVIVGNNKDDLATITSLCDKGLNALHPYFKFGRINDDWKKEVSLGFKAKDNTRHEWSKIFIRNTDSGTATEVVAGTTPKALILDEAGKSSFMEVFAAAKPAFESPYGWRAVPIIVGTGGSVENGQDLKKMFDDPDTYNMVAMELPEEGGLRTCVFVSGTYSLQFEKIKTTIGDYFNIENKNSELYTIPYFYSDHKENKEIILAKRAELDKAKDSAILLKEKMYFPLTSDECFLTESDNNFPIEAAIQQLDFITRNEDLHGTPSKLIRDVTGKIESFYDDKKKVIWDFPHEKGTDLDAPFVIWEKPMKDAPMFLYIAGIDPYNQDSSTSSPSLGSLYIYKRIYDPIGGTFQQRIVASYVARPSTMKEWHENAEMLLEYYNAVAMIENAGTNFIQYMDNKNKSYMLADGYSLLKEISPTSSITGRNKGLPPTLPTIKHCMNLLLDYCKEEIVIGMNPDNTPIMALGIVRITDPILLKELIAYKKGINVDRIVAFRHILAYDKHLEKIYTTIDIPDSDRIAKIIPKKTNSSPFDIGTRHNPFSGVRNPFL